MSSFDPWESAFYLTSKRLCSFVFISTSEIGFPFSCTHLHTFYLRPGKPDSWGSRQSLDVAHFNTWAPESAEDAGQATRMPGPSNDFLWSPIRSWHSGSPQLTGRASCDLLLYGSTRPQITPRKFCQPTKTQSRQGQIKRLCRAASCTRGRHDSRCQCLRSAPC